MVQDRAILTMADWWEVVYDLLFGAIFSYIEWPVTQIEYDAECHLLVIATFCVYFFYFYVWTEECCSYEIAVFFPDIVMFDSHPLTSNGQIWDVMLVWRKGNIEKKLSLCYSVVYYYNDAQRYKQFSQVGRLLGFDLVKLSPKRPIMCRVGRWTLLYDVWQLNN